MNFGIIYIVFVSLIIPVNVVVQTKQAPDRLPTLLKNQAPGLDPFESQLGCPSGILGAYLAELFTYGTERRGSDIASLSFQCQTDSVSCFNMGVENSFRYSHWFCSIDVINSDRAEESPWYYSLLYLINRKTGKLELKPIACPGV